MKFLDEARIEVKAGNGGAGLSHFRREKFVPLGGPDGGNGGKGGSVFIVVDPNRSTLLDLHMHPKWQAKNGRPGGANNRSGKCGEDLTIRVPCGTQVLRNEDSSLVVDLSENGQSFALAKGGRGGKGNDHFKSSTNRAPEHSQPGEEGEGGIYRLSLKLVADVGLMGLPNAGKSTLISRISEARPKIADYPFTTLAPNLGVVRYGDEKSYVVADIPGLIPGAHDGKGLGLKFLKHIERTRVLAHLIDINQLLEDASKGDALQSYNALCRELRLFSEDVAAKPQLVVFTKMDTLTQEKEFKDAISAFQRNGVDFCCISSVRGDGLKDLIERLGRIVFDNCNCQEIS